MRNEWGTLRDKVVGLQVGGKCLYLIVKSPRVSHHGKNVEGGVVMHCQESKPWTEEQDKQKMQKNPMESMLAREAGGGAFYGRKQPILPVTPPEIAEVLTEMSVSTPTAAEYLFNK